ncbi:vesicle transport protein SFT2B-like [Eucyclogobius newberryi]|uniref:vesicle transport protein SFT2B-like n=1 Tax=Eucyclogobius newberryi TaxID=166745 RepID=UPI003B5CFC4F
MKAFVICFVLGLACSVAGTSTLYIPGVGLGVFAMLYSVGNICCLLSITFLIGPKNQIMTMCAKERAVATIVLLVRGGGFCTGLTLMAALQWQNSVLALVFCILQLLAFLWYTLSYVPFARTGVAKLCSVICC